jgi:hypothetical protein
VKCWPRIATTALLGIMLCNFALATGFFVQRRHLDHVREYSPLKGADRVPPVSGIDVNGALWQSKAAKCHVLRVTDDGCTFCRRDLPNYQRLIAVARDMSCEIIEIAPQAGRLGRDPRPGIVQMKYVTAALGPAVYPFVTPETVVLDKDWSVRYIRRGMFDEETLDDAIEVLRRMTIHVDR